MANDYIVRLQGQDNLSGTIRNAQRSINELGGSANRLDAIQQRFNRIEQSSAPLNKKLKDVKRAMEQLAVTGDTSSELFQRMAQAAQRYQQALDQVNQATRRVDSASGQMNGRLGNLRNIANEVASRSGFGGIASSLGAIATPAGAATAAVAAVGVVMVQAGKAAAEFETHLDSLQSLTGLSDEAMQDISKGAIEMSKEFKSSASDIVDAMKLIGSQAPELLSDKDALMEVTKAANVLAEAAQIEVVDAAKGITTVMNQMGVSASEASNIINVLAASSQQGSADVAYLNTAFEKAGTAAKSAGMNYVELSAAIETVAPKFSSADVAGSQLASTLLQLSMKASNDFKPSVVGMSQALENLAAAQLSDAEIARMVGESNVTMLKSLIEGRSTFDGYTQSLAGTNTAYEQMTINNDNFEGAVTRLKSAWDALLITLGQSGVLQGIADGVMDIMGLLNDIINVISDVISTFDLFGSDVTDNCNISKIQIQMLSDIIKGIGTVLQIVVAVAAKAFNAIKDVATNVANGIQNKWNQLKGTLTDNAFVQNIANAWTTIYNKAVEIIGKVKKLWNDFLQWLGLEGKSTSVPAPMKAGTVKSTSTTSTELPTNTRTSTRTPSVGGSRRGGGRGTTNTTRTTQTPPEVGSIAALEQAYRKLDDELKNTVVSDARLAEINAEKAALEEQIKQLKIRNGLLVEKKEEPKQVKSEAKEGSIAYVQKQISDKQAALKLEVVGSDEWKALSKEIADLTNKQHIIDVQIANNLSEDDAKKLIEFDEAFTATMDKVKGQAGVIDTIGGSFSQLGGAIGGTAGKMLEFAGQSAQAVAQIIPQIVALIGAKQGEALASGTASAAALPFPANIAAIASIIATITALFASFAGSFADGGIISGGSFHGDKMLARVNAGEMILNPMQQSNLFNALNGGGAVGGMRNVEFKISGSTLKGCLNNYDKKQSRLK